jgi:Relaxase/Mobilisation nuclease domain
MIGRISKDLNFAEVFTHLFNPEKDYLFLLKSQCCDGQNVSELAREFQVVANLCPSKRLPVRHIFISLDRTEQGFSNDLKIEIVSTIIQKMGFESCQYIAIELNLYDLYYSDDRDLSGIHIVANAVNLNGRKIADFKDAHKLEKVIREIKLSLETS